MRRVLLVDGYEESRNATAHQLRTASHEVVAVEEEDDAVRAVETSAFDVVLLDLPFVEAEEAARSIRSAGAKQGRLPSSIIALVEPSTPRHVRDQGRASGIDYFILRPCPPAEMVKHLRRMQRGAR
jgi:CheY-like chemotaxis protein